MKIQRIFEDHHLVLVSEYNQKYTNSNRIGYIQVQVKIPIMCGIMFVRKECTITIHLMKDV